MGMVTLVTLIPELKLGILVFTNQQSGACMHAVTGFILDRSGRATGFTMKPFPR